MTAQWRSRTAPELADAAERCCWVDISAPGFRERSLATAAVAAKEADITGIVVEDVVVDRPNAPALALRLYTPDTAAAPAPAIVHFHGGGFVSGGLDTGHGRLAALSREVGAVVVSVDYRLSPEHRYPAAFVDGRDALTWLHGNAAARDVDPARVALHGVSAGGALAAAVALAAKDLPIPALRLQYLSMALLDDRLSNSSAKTFIDTPVWNRANALHAWSSYLGAPPPAVVAIHAAPGRASIEELVGVAPAHVSVLELDPTRDEGIEYAQRLLTAGTSVGMTLWAGAFHAFMSMAPGAEISRRHDAEESRVLRCALRTKLERAEPIPDV
jgi:acetyl esterase